MTRSSRATIICGTDFSAASADAVQVAALLGVRIGARLELVHVVDEVGAEEALASDSALFNPVRLKLRAVAQRARELGASVSEELVAGDAAKTLSAMSAVADVRLVVVSSTGQRSAARWLLGSVAERTARSSRAPVLVVRSTAPFVSWLRDERPLRVLLGSDPSGSSDAALRWIGELRAIAPCDVTVVRFAWPPREHDRLGIHAPIDPDGLHPDVEDTVIRELAEAAADLRGNGELRFMARRSVGHVDHELTVLAEGLGVDLVVVGARQRSGIDRLFHGSVSRGVLQLSATNVASVPQQMHVETSTVPSVRRVLVATDFSACGGRAVLAALGLLPNGGSLHVVHVIAPAAPRTPVTQILDRRDRTARDEDWREDVATAHERMDRLAREAPAPHGVHVVVDVLEGDVADEVDRAAERYGVDVVCIGSRGRSKLASALLGSVAQRLLVRSRRPVLVVPPDGR